MALHDELTLLLRQVSQGDSGAIAPLLKIVQPRLEKVASNILRKYQLDPLLQPVDLVSELYLKLFLLV